MLLLFGFLFLGIRASPALHASSSFDSNDINGLRLTSLSHSSTSGYTISHTKEVVDVDNVISSSTSYSIHSASTTVSERDKGTFSSRFTRMETNDPTSVQSLTPSLRTIALETSIFLSPTISTTAFVSSVPSPSTSGSLSSNSARNLDSTSSSTSTASSSSSNSGISTTPSKSVITTLIVFGVLASIIIGTFIALKYTAKEPSNHTIHPDTSNYPSISEPFPPGSSPRSAKYAYAFSGDGDGGRYEKHSGAGQRLLRAYSPSAAPSQSTRSFVPQLPSTVQALEQRRIKEDEDEKVQWLQTAQVY